MRIPAMVLALGLCACGTSSQGGPPAAAAPGAAPPLVQAKCGACHRPPAPHPLKDGEALRRAHEKRVRLTPEESAEVFAWVQGAGSGQNR